MISAGFVTLREYGVGQNVGQTLTHTVTHKPK